MFTLMTSVLSTVDNPAAGLGACEVAVTAQLLAYQGSIPLSKRLQGLCPLNADSAAAAGGGDLLGLGYTSDGDSQDSVAKPQQVKAESESEEASRPLGAEPNRDPSMSPQGGAGGWVKAEEDEQEKHVKADADAGTFVKGQRCAVTCQLQ